MAKKHTLMGIFSRIDEVAEALKFLREAAIKVDIVYSPVPSLKISHTLGLTPSPVRYFTLGGGIAGMIIGFGLSIYAGLKWNFIVSGKPVIALIPFFVEGFEFTILFGVLATVAGMLIYNRMPKLRLPPHYDPRFTQDKFGILVRCSDAEREGTISALQKAGAEEIRDIT